MQRFSVTLFGLINFIVLIRFLFPRPEQMGVWALFLAITTIFETMSPLGTRFEHECVPAQLVVDRAAEPEHCLVCHCLAVALAYA